MKQVADLAVQIKALTAVVTQLATTKENSNPNATRGNGGGNRKSRRLQIRKFWNMGGYCSSHGFHPVGAGHNSTTCRWQKREHNTDAMWNNWLGGNMFWPTATRVAIEQQDHPTWKGKLAPTNWQGLGIASRVKNNAELFKTEQSLASNHYACLSPPPCQVKEHDHTCNSTTPAHKPNPRHQAHNNTVKKQDSIANIRDSMPTSRRYVISEDDNLLWRGMENGTIPSVVVDSGCTSGVGTSDDPCRRTGRAFKKKFFLPGGKIVNATKITEYPFKVKAPAQELLITPGVTKNSLLSTSKFADANYITIFDKEAVNIYDANKTTITVTRGAILRSFKCPTTGMWCIPLVDLVRNNNADTVMVNCPPLEFLQVRPPPTNAIHNVYELKTQPELV
jgi:hypothetical protein